MGLNKFLLHLGGISMQYKEFRTEFEKELESLVKARYLNLKLKTGWREKTNKKLEYLIIYSEGNELQKLPVYYFQPLFNEYLKKPNVSLKDYAAAFLDEYFDNVNKISQVNWQGEITKEYILQNVFLACINYEKNKELLQTVPHLKYLDLAITYRLRFGYGDSEFYSVLVDSALLKGPNLSEKDIFEAAKPNTKTILKLYYKTYTLESNNVYQIRSQTGGYAAVCIYLKDLIREIAKKHKSDLFVVPSSTDNLIVELYDKNKESEYIKNLTMLNMYQTLAGSSELYLSNNLYHYHLSNDDITIIKSDNQRGKER